MILFPQCYAIWRPKSCYFSGTKSVETARWRTVCATSCHLSRISYELFVKCVTPNVTHVHLTTISSWQVVTPWKWIFEHFKIFATTWHALRHMTRISTHPRASPRTLSRVLPSLARKIACHGVNRWSCQCDAFNTQRLMCLTFGVLQQCLAPNTSVNFVFISYAK